MHIQGENIEGLGRLAILLESAHDSCVIRNAARIRVAALDAFFNSKSFKAFTNAAAGC